jgi:hypothetical protein
VIPTAWGEKGPIHGLAVGKSNSCAKFLTASAHNGEKTAIVGLVIDYCFQPLDTDQVSEMKQPVFLRQKIRAGY